jgi:hypothetical protein
MIFSKYLKASNTANGGAEGGKGGALIPSALLMGQEKNHYSHTVTLNETKASAFCFH